MGLLENGVLTECGKQVESSNAKLKIQKKFQLTSSKVAPPLPSCAGARLTDGDARFNGRVFDSGHFTQAAFGLFSCGAFLEL